MLSINQLEVSNTLDGPLLVIAGAGSGKTLCLVERVFNLLVNKKVSPAKIIITTFTEKAAKELKIRINKKIENENYKIDINDMYIGTMHSIWKRLIMENISKSRFMSEFSIMEDEIEQKFFIYSKLKYISKIDGYKEYLDYYNYLNNNKAIAKDLRDKFNDISENAINIENLSSDDRVILFLKKAYKYYEELLIENNIMDFAYLQVELLNMLKNDKELLLKLNEKIDYIMVDEYQDSNRIQEKIIFLIAGYKKNICVVGDEDQAIYRFRGATVDNILNFQENIGSNCKKIFLNTNYRSNIGIVDFSKKWIESIDWLGNRFYKNIDSSDITKINSVYKVVENDSEKNAKIIVNFVKHLKEENKISNYNQVAVLFSSFRDRFSKILAKQFDLNGIQVYSPRAKNFFNRHEVQVTFGILLACLKGYYDIKNILEDNKYLSEYDKYLLNCLNLARKEARNDEYLLDYIKKQINKKEFRDFNKLFYSFFQFDFYAKILSNKNLDIVDNREIYNLGILSSIFKKYYNHTNVILDNEETIISFIKYFFEIYLKEIKEHGVSEFENHFNSIDNKVQFLTIHESKGLEFPVVIVSSLYESVVHEEENLDKFKELIKFEENFTTNNKKTFDMYRKFYVAFTRARDLLLLTGVDGNISEYFRKSIHDIPKLNHQDKFFVDSLVISESSPSNLVETFSYTQDIYLYKYCPLKYFFIRKARFNSYENKSINLGIIAHKIIENINKNFLFYENKYFLNLLKDEIYKMINRIVKLKKINITEEDYIRINNMVFKYFMNERQYFNNIKYIESSEYLITDSFILYGEIDLVREYENKYELIDFKTGKYNESILKNYNEQLIFYNILLKGKVDKEIESYLYYLEEENSKIKISITDKDIENYRLAIYNTINDIREEKFEAINYEEKKCVYCEFSSYCLLRRN